MQLTEGFKTLQNCPDIRIVHSFLHGVQFHVHGFGFELITWLKLGKFLRNMPRHVRHQPQPSAMSVLSIDFGEDVNEAQERE